MTRSACSTHTATITARATLRPRPTVHRCPTSEPHTCTRACTRKRTHVQAHARAHAHGCTHALCTRCALQYRLRHRRSIQVPRRFPACVGRVRLAGWTTDASRVRRSTKLSPLSVLSPRMSTHTIASPGACMLVRPRVHARTQPRLATPRAQRCGPARIAVATQQDRGMLAHSRGPSYSNVILDNMRPAWSICTRTFLRTPPLLAMLLRARTAEPTVRAHSALCVAKRANCARQPTDCGIASVQVPAAAHAPEQRTGRVRAGWRRSGKQRKAPELCRVGRISEIGLSSGYRTARWEMGAVRFTFEHR